MLSESYIGRIVSIDDPEYKGRVKVSVFGIHETTQEDLGKIDEKDLPYAYPVFPIKFGKNGAGAFSTPRKDTIVRVIFDGDQYHPRYFSAENIDEDLKSKIKDEGYENFHSLIFDSENKLGIYFSKKSGVLIDLDKSLINIKADNSILIQTKDNPSFIELNGDVITIKTNNDIQVTSNNTIGINSNEVDVNGVTTTLGANPIYSNMNGEIWVALIKTLMTAIDSAKYPSAPGVLMGIVQAIEPSLLSKTVTTSP